MIFTYLNDVFTKVYNIVVCKIYIPLYGIKFSIKLSKVFGYKQSKICADDICKAKYLSFSQVKISLLKTFKKQLHISTKLVKDKSILQLT